MSRLLLCLLFACCGITPALATELNDSPPNADDFEGLFRIGSVWSFVAAFDLDDRRSHPAVIDIGINAGETRTPEDACTISYVPGTSTDVDCSSGFGNYTGLMNELVEGNSPYTNHGERMKNRIAATINDSGLAGVAGQVAIPHLYRFTEITGFLFELDTTIQRAVQDGATAINISAGFPCRMLWFDDFTGDICSTEGRLAYCALSLTHGIADSLSNLVNANNSAAVNYLQAATPLIKGALCTAVGASALVEGDLRSRINAATRYARTQGVPIIASAGNVWDPLALGNEEIELTPMASNDITSWGILPATANHVIAVGAVERGTSGFANADFHGNRVDIWAPAGDTSPAAAYVSGVVAVAQALNKDLDPRNPNLSKEQRSTIVHRIRTALKDTAYTSDDPQVAADTYRRNLINPYGFIRSVTSGLVPDFEGLGYTTQTDDLLNENSENYPDDDDFWTINMVETYSYPVPGTIVYLPGTPSYSDTDRFTLRTPKKWGPYRAVVDLYYLKDYGHLALDAELPGGATLQLIETRDEGPERRLRFHVEEVPANADFSVTIRGFTPEDDNVYKLRARVEDLSGPGRVKPDPQADADELRRFVEQMELVFRGTPLPEVGCLECNTLGTRGSIALPTNTHPTAGRGAPGNARALRFLKVESAGRYDLMLEAGRSRSLSGLNAQVLNEAGKVMGTTRRGRLSVDLAPGVYLVTVNANVSGRQAVEIGYQFSRNAGARMKRATAPARSPAPSSREKVSAPRAIKAPPVQKPVPR